MTLQKQKGTSPKQHQALSIIASSFVNSNWSYGPETVKLGCDLCDLDFWPLTLTFCLDITSVINNDSWKFHDDTMMLKRCDRQTDRRAENTIHLAAWSQLKKIHRHIWVETADSDINAAWFNSLRPSDAYMHQSHYNKPSLVQILDWRRLFQSLLTFCLLGQQDQF